MKGILFSLKYANIQNPNYFVFFFCVKVQSQNLLIFVCLVQGPEPELSYWYYFCWPRSGTKMILFFFVTIQNRNYPVFFFGPKSGTWITSFSSSWDPEPKFPFTNYFFGARYGTEIFLYPYYFLRRVPEVKRSSTFNDLTWGSQPQLKWLESSVNSFSMTLE